jgi:hypothetical protein
MQKIKHSYTLKKNNFFFFLFKLFFQKINIFYCLKLIIEKKKIKKFFFSPNKNIKELIY